MVKGVREIREHMASCCVASWHPAPCTLRFPDGDTTGIFLSILLFVLVFPSVKQRFGYIYIYVYRYAHMCLMS